MESPIRTGKSAKLLGGVTVKTLQRWDHEGWFVPVGRTNSHRHLYTETQIVEFVSLRKAVSEPT
uniref:MerR family transcriptional regulator n=1 Tax=Methylacidiphilum kamchatkense TaxID=431057 RepID=UPI000ABC7B0C|nr:MerR family transcriptional regulator [Methylacidiphilum kamchatkense]